MVLIQCFISKRTFKNAIFFNVQHRLLEQQCSMLLLELVLFYTNSIQYAVHDSFANTATKTEISMIKSHPAYY